MLRAIILSLVLFVAFGTIVPVATEYSEASVNSRLRKTEKKKRALKYRRMAMKRKSARQTTAVKKRKTSKRRVARKAGKARTTVRRTARKATARRAKPRKRVRTKTRSTVARRRVRTGSKKAVSTKRKTTRRYTAKRTKKRVTRRAVSRRTTAKRTVRKKRTRKYTQKWFAARNQQQARKQRVAKRKRNLRIRTIRAERIKAADTTTATARLSRIQRQQASAFMAPVSAEPAPIRMQYKPAVPVSSGIQQVVSGDVSMEVVGTASGETVTKGRNTAVGGISTTALRRTVIDQMIQESGWVENDYHKEIAGKKVYVVVAKAPDKNNRVQAKTYYFTEANGRIYRVASSSSNESTESAKARSEELIRTLDDSARPQQAQNQ